jgi:SAM-dependent methyltransferase
LKALDALGRRLRALLGARAGATTELVGSTPEARSLKALTRTQQLFLEWNAERLGISVAASHARYAASWAQFRKGHAGRQFHRYNERAHEVFRVFYDDAEREVYDTYRYHGPMHLLMMLTYPEPAWTADHLIVRTLSARGAVTILDFGCGLAQQSRTLAEFLQQRGVTVELVLVDIETLRRDLLLYACARCGIAARFLACTAAAPIPPLPPVDLCIATEFFEHVHDPGAYFERIDAALKPGGLLVTEISDHYAGFMHVSPSLERLRAAVAARGYEEVLRHKIYRKSVRG